MMFKTLSSGRARNPALDLLTIRSIAVDMTRTESRTPLVAVAIVLIALAGCSTSGGGSPDSAEGIGVPGTFTLHGTNITLTGDIAIDDPVTAPFTLHISPAFPDDRRFLIVPNGSIDGEHGILIIESATAEFNAGRIPLDEVKELSVADGTARITAAPREGTGVGPEFPERFDEADSAHFHGESLLFPRTEFTISSFDNAVFIQRNSSTAVEPPVTVTTGEFVVDDTVTVTTAADAAITATSRDFATGGRIDSGEVALEDGRIIDDPVAVFGRRGRFSVDEEAITTTAETEITQVLTGDGPAIDAAVEFDVVESSVTVAANRQTWVKTRYRETSRRGDGVLHNITVSGDGSSMVTVPRSEPPLLIQRYTAFLIDAGETFPPALLGLLGSPAVILIDLVTEIGCALGECPSDHPFPVWIDAGSDGVFYFRVDGSQPPGTYTATITIEGENYETTELPATITVKEAEEQR